MLYISTAFATLANTSSSAEITFTCTIAIYTLIDVSLYFLCFFTVTIVANTCSMTVVSASAFSVTTTG